MLEPKQLRMQSLSRELINQISGSHRRAPKTWTPLPIDRITNQRMPDVRHMHPNLMRATRFQLDLNPRTMRCGFRHPVMGHRRLPGIHHCHFRSLQAMAVHGRVNRAFFVGVTVNQCDVLTTHRAIFELFHEIGLCLQRSRHCQNTTGFFIESMNNARSWDFFQFRKLREQRIHQGS